ncbi:GNAT family N-acetyltransferase [Chloroflexota bacterium]
MNGPHYTIRNYSQADFDGYVELNTLTEKLEPTGRSTSPETVSETLNQPNYSPEHDMFVIETGGKIVGFASVTPERVARRVILDCAVHPEHRRLGLAARLLDCALQRAREVDARLAHVNIREDNTVANSVLSRLGFGVVRRFLELRLQLSESQIQEAAHDAYLCRHLQPGEEDKLTRIQNRCFAGTFGYNPNTTEETVHRLNSGRRSPEDVVLICGNDKPVAYCWTIIYPENGVDNVKKSGRIYMIGVDPDFRGRGIGRISLLAGLSHLKTRGVEVVDLTVDSENRPARALYQSIGFKVWTSSFWYEKSIG